MMKEPVGDIDLGRTYRGREERKREEGREEGG